MAHREVFFYCEVDDDKWAGIGRSPDLPLPYP